MKRNAFIDHQEMAAQYRAGDKVYYVEPLRMRKAPYVGVVADVHAGIGYVDVQFIWGTERLSPEYLTFVDGPSEDMIDEQGTRVSMNISDAANRLVRAYRKRVDGLYVTASDFARVGIEEMDAYGMLFERYQNRFSDHEIKQALSLAYDVSVGERQAMYWKEKGRQYVPTQKELETGCFHCPRCKTELKRAIYKKWTKLYACPDCLFLIKPADILDSLDDAAREEAEEDLGWDLDVSDPSKAFNEWL